MNEFELKQSMERACREFKLDQVPLPQPSDWRRRFHQGRFDALDIEIGCGVGMHPIQYSIQSPNRFLVAIEHTRSRYHSFHRRYLNHDSPKNLFPVHGNAISWVSHELNPLEVDKVFILYPNPYPKVKDRSKRFYAMPFMKMLVSKLKQGGNINLATNDERYAEESVVFLTEVFQLRLISSSKEKRVARTHFEKKYQMRGDTCIDLLFSK